MKAVALILFIVMYVIMISRPNWRMYAAASVALIFIITGIIPREELGPAIDFNVLLMIAGTMIAVEFFIKSKMPNLLADYILDKAPNVMWVTIYMSLFSGAISAFIDNVATVLMVAPVALVLCKKINVNPIPMVLSVAVSSNLQGAATLVGDTTSIMLGAYAHMDFTSFFWMNGRPGIFFAVELGALATVLVMMILFHNMRQPVSASEYTKVENHFPSYALVSIVVLLIIASFIPNKPDETNGIICCLVALVTAIQDRIYYKKWDNSKAAFASVDTNTIALLTSMFIVIGGLKNVGIIDSIADIISSVGGNNLFVLYTIIVWGSVLISAFVDNIPYVATMLPVIAATSRSLGIEPYLLYFGLLSGATLGGNLTPVGASANITAMGLLNKAGFNPSMKDFFRIGIPFTLVAVTVGYGFIWLFWH